MPRLHSISWIQGVMLVALATAMGKPLLGQQEPESRLVESGKASVGGAEVAYRVRSLPVGSFPELPGPIADALNTRSCVIPQTYGAKRPENVIHGSFEKPGSSDWAALCSVKGQVSLLVFFGSVSPSQPAVLATAAVRERLQDHDLTGELGFDWGIDAVTTPQFHDAQAGLAHRVAAPDHDSIADSIIDHRTVYHLYRKGGWEKVVVE